MDNKKLFFPFSWVVLSLLIGSGPVFGQGQVQVQANPSFEFRKFYVDELKSPNFDTKSFDYTKNSEDWLQIVCEYRVMHPDLWLDNITFKWHVHLLGSEFGPMVFTKSVTYDKIQADGKEDQRGVLYLSPRDIRRWFSSRGTVPSSSKVVVYIEVQADGVKMTEFQYPTGRVSGLPQNWWANRNVRRVDNVFLSRIESPWIHHDHETWVPERPSVKPVSR